MTLQHFGHFNLRKLCIVTTIIFSWKQGHTITGSISWMCIPIAKQVPGWYVTLLQSCGCSKTLSWLVTNGHQSLDIDQFRRLGFSPNNSRISDHYRIMTFCKTWPVCDDFWTERVEIQDNQNPIGWNLCVFLGSLFCKVAPPWTCCLVPQNVSSLTQPLSKTLTKISFKASSWGKRSKFLFQNGQRGVVPICVPWNVWNSWIPRSHCMAPALCTGGQKWRWKKSTSQGLVWAKGVTHQRTNSP